MPKAKSAPPQSLPAGPKIWLADAQNLQLTHVGAKASAQSAAQSLATGQGAPLAMINGDFDGDGIEDLAVGYATPGGGAIVLHRGNLDAFAPQSEASFQAIGRGQFPPPFLAEAKVYDISVRPDFIAAGNFMGSGRLDLVVASRGRNALYVLANDGSGKFKAPQLVQLTGTVTTLAAENLGIGQSLGNVLVGLSGPNKTFSLLVLGGTELGFGAVGNFPLLAAASNIHFGDFGDRGPDAAFLSGDQVVLLHSSTMQLESLSLPVSVSALALGSFLYDRNPDTQIALLDSNGSIHIAAHNEFDPRVRTVEEMKAIRDAVLRREPSPLIPRQAVAMNGWKIVESIPSATPFTPGQPPMFMRTRVSNHGPDDVMVLNASLGQMAVIFHPDPVPGAATFQPAQISTRPYAGSPVAAISTRVNVDGRPGVIALHDGQVAPLVVMPLPDPTFFPNRFDDIAPRGTGVTCLNTTGVDASNDCTLREAIIKANGDTISLQAGTYTLTRAKVTNDFSGNNGALYVNNSVTIVGAGQNSTIIQAGTNNANGVDMVMAVNEDISPLTNATASISNLTMRFGNNRGTHAISDSDGGCMEFDTGTSGTANLFLTNVTLTDCTTHQGNGGAIAIFNFLVNGAGQPTIVNSIIQNNTVVETVGGPSGGGIWVSIPARMSMTNSQVINNVATQINGAGRGLGGGIRIDANGTTRQTVIHSSTISGNQASGPGGGIWSDANLVIDQGTVIRNNTAGANGGGAQDGGGLFHNPQPAQSASLSKVTITGNSATGTGGGVASGNLSIGGPLTISFSRLANNTAGTGSNLNNLGSAITATNNWWGTNTPATTINNANGGTTTFDPFIQFTHTASPPAVQVTQTTTLTASLAQDNHGSTGALAGNLDVLIALPITINSAVLGTLSNVQTAIQANGAAAATFTAGTVSGTGHADAAVDNATVTANITINPGPATHFTVTAPTAATAGSAFSITVTALDQFNNVATGYTGTVHFTSSDGAAVLPTDSTLTNGVGTFSSTLKTAGNQTITATDTVTASITGTSGTIAVNPAAATHYVISAPASATGGVAFNFTVTALDQFNNTTTGYAGTVHFTSTDGLAVLPANSTLTNGTGTFSATLKTGGNQTITGTDTVTASITGTSGTINVISLPATHFTVSAPASATAGSAFSFTVTALDVNNNLAFTYAGTVHYTSSDGAAVLPANSTLTNGVGTFSATLKTAGNQTITATDTVAASITGTSGTVAVSPAAATHYSISAPATATGSVAFNFTVTALDQFNNTATGYAGTVHFTSSDGAGVLPANSTLTNGAGAFSPTLKTAGNQTITATDTVTASITGTSGNILVTVLPATHFVVSAPASATAGTAFNFTVTALDLNNNTAIGYAGTVHFTSTDGAAVLPANSTLTNGVGTFSATLKTAGNQTITATDTVTASITGTSGTIAVSAAAATHYVISAPASATAGNAFNFTVTALDQFNNTATGYAGTAHFTATDGAATLPVNSTLTNGAGTFSATLRTVGNQTITATDTVSASITATSNTISVSSLPATHFAVTVPASATAGTAFNFTVTALDVNNNTAIGYAGTVHFTSTDGLAVLPANSTLTNGLGTFSATLKSKGNQTISATDTVTGSITGTSNTIAVGAAAATHYVVTAPATAVVGLALNFTVTALDQFNNAATAYAGTVHFTSSDGAAVLPANSTLTNGAGAFSATLKTPGNQTITATDTVTASITGISNVIAVSPPSDLTITKSHTGNFFQGQTGAAYTLTVNNSGSSPTVGAVTVTDTLPAGLTATAVAGTGWTCTLGTLTCTRSDVLAAGTSYSPITLTANVAANAPASITNIATVSGGGELNAANDTATDVTTVTAPPDFTLSFNLTTITVKAGQPASYALTVTPQNNAFANPIAFTASGLPGKTSFVFNPSPLTPGANPATTTLVVSTTAGDPFIATNSDKSHTPLYALLLPFSGLVLSGLGFRKRKLRKGRSGWVLIAVMLVCSGFGLYGCAGAQKNFQNLGTPTGTYTVTITATSGAVQHSAPVTLIVQP